LYVNTSFAAPRDKCFVRKVWKYNQCDYLELNNALSTAPWEVGALLEGIDEQQFYFSTLFTDILEEHIPHFDIIVRPRDKPWMNGHIRHLLRCRNRLFRRFRRTQLLIHEEAWKVARRSCNYHINKSKLDYAEKLRKMLSDPNIDAKKYWKLAKLVYGSKKHFGIPALVKNGHNITSSVGKAEALNEYFAYQQRPIVIPDGHQLPPIIFRSEARLDSLETSADDVYKVLKGLNISKASGPDGIGNRILKETAKSISKPLASLFNQSFASGVFPADWKSANVSPVFKKNDRSSISNYRPVSLLNYTAKVQERIVFNVLYTFFIDSNLLTWRNSGFKKGDSVMNQLLFISEQIYKSLEDGRDVCTIFLDISKAFDRVWHEGLLHKLRCFGIGGSLFEWIASYLKNRRQRVVINGQFSNWSSTYSGVPQGSILGPLLFLVFINDIVEDMECDAFLFADDTSLLETISNTQISFLKINRDLDRLSRWAGQWLVEFNEGKSVYMILSRKKTLAQYPDLFLNGTALSQVQAHCHLGININTRFTWDVHIRKLVDKASKCVNLLKRICRDVPRSCLENLYKTMIRPIMEYGDILFDGERLCHTQVLEGVQRQAALCCTGAYRHTSHNSLLHELGWEPLDIRRRHHRLNMFYKIHNHLVPEYLTIPPAVCDVTSYNLRNRRNITLPRARSESYKRSFFSKYHSGLEWTGSVIEG
jgi:hypothetical protein